MISFGQTNEERMQALIKKWQMNDPNDPIETPMREAVALGIALGREEFRSSPEAIQITDADDDRPAFLRKIMD